MKTIKTALLIAAVALGTMIMSTQRADAVTYVNPPNTYYGSNFSPYYYNYYYNYVLYSNYYNYYGDNYNTYYLGFALPYYYYYQAAYYGDYGGYYQDSLGHKSSYYKGSTPNWYSNYNYPYAYLGDYYWDNY
ncbi:MAG: hypothetical protein JOY92_04305 [Verrucomicrobia bacterium]|nr:hypothetical protein [Verrucomicrobiota bacterium]